MAHGNPEMSYRDCSREETLSEIFHNILSFTKRMNEYRKPASFFVIYAHENPNFDYPADAEVVREMIQWFGEAGCAIQSDATPPAQKKITDCQLCLLPYGDFPRHSVQNVILCGSKLLGHYMKCDGFPELVSDVVGKYCALKCPANSEKQVRDFIVDVQKKYSKEMGGDFHHVLTEIALLKTRVLTERNSSIITFQLNGNPKESLPDYLTEGDNYLRTTIGHVPLADGSVHACFLEILEKLNLHESDRTGNADLIRSMRNIYQEAEESFSDLKQLQQTKYVQDLGVAWLEWTKKQRPFTLVDFPGLKTALREYARKLSIKTVLGHEISIDRYDVALEVAEPSKSAQASQRAKEVLVSVEQIFDEQPLLHGRKGIPRRILLRGRAGTGKTTLGLQILHHMDQAPWKRFEWILWVPLGRLRREKDFTDFMRKEYFKENYDLANSLREIVFNQNNKDDILLILDGWDETSRASEDSMRLVSELASFQNVIITSRFSPVNLKHMDLVFDVVGFNNHMVTSYVKSRVSDDCGRTSNEIQTFLDKHQSAKEAFRAPMLLELLCSFWKTSNQGPIRDIQTGPSVTMLYQTIVVDLWRKIIPTFHEPAWDAESIADIPPRHIEREVNPIIRCLGRIAMQLFERGESVISREDIEKLADSEGSNQQARSALLAPNVMRTPFLQKHERSTEITYSFVHKTFQEFFAAQSLVSKPPELKLCLKRYKYDPDFTAILRFVTGLLSTRKTDGQLRRFFYWVEEEPRDLIGPAHEKLVMQCLSQVPQSRISWIRSWLEQRMKRWIFFEYEWGTSSCLIRHIAFPDHIRKAILTDQNVQERVKEEILRAFRRRGSQSMAIQSLMSSWLLKDNISPGLKQALLDTWDGFYLSEETLNELKTLKGLQSSVHDSVVDILRDCAPLQVEDPEDLLLRRGNDQEKYEAIAAPCGSKDLPDNYLKALINEGLRSRQSSEIQNIARDVLVGLENVSPNASEMSGIINTMKAQHDAMTKKKAHSGLQWDPSTKSLLAKLSDSNGFLVRNDAALHLRSRARYSPTSELFDDLVKMLLVANTPDQRLSIMIALRQENLPSNAVSALLKTFKEGGQRVKIGAGKALILQDSLSPQDLLTLLQHGEDHETKGHAASVLIRRDELPPEMVQQAISQINYMSVEHLLTLSYRTDLPDDVTWAICDLMSTASEEIRSFGMIVLGEQQNLSPRAVKYCAWTAFSNKGMIKSQDMMHLVARVIENNLEVIICELTTGSIVGELLFQGPFYKILLWISLRKPFALSFNDHYRLCENSVPRFIFDKNESMKLFNSIRRRMIPATPSEYGIFGDRPVRATRPKFEQSLKFAALMLIGYCEGLFGSLNAFLFVPISFCFCYDISLVLLVLRLPQYLNSFWLSWVDSE